MVVKKDGTLRMCVDYRSLNSKTVSDPYQMPRVEEVLESLSEAEYISKIDLNKGYYQIPINLDDQPKTAFRSSWGIVSVHPNTIWVEKCTGSVLWTGFYTITSRSPKFSSMM